MARATRPRALQHALEPALKALGAAHRRTVAQAIGAARDTPEAIAAVLRDEEALASIVAGLDSPARRLVSALAFAPTYGWSAGARTIDPEAADTLERHGLLFTFGSYWGASAVTARDLEASLQRIRARAHATGIPEATVPEAAPGLHAPDQLLHDAVGLAAVIGAGGIQLKNDGDLFARAVPKLMAALAPLASAELAPDAVRMDLALRTLEENGALRVRALGAAGGQTSKRELALAVDVPDLLDVQAPQRAALMDAIMNRPMPGRAIIDAVLDACAGRTVTLAGLGGALRALFAEAGQQVAYAPPGADELVVAWAAVIPRWLRGDCALHLDSDSAPSAVTFAPAAPVDASGPPCLAQSDFELVAMRPMTPGERAVLLSVAEPVPGREHVARLTKERVQGARRAAPGLDVVARLRTLAPDLPQNVEQTVAGWAQQVTGRARLRTAMMVAAPDEATAERLAFALGPLMVERLSPTLLAIDAANMAQVGKAVAAAGVDLDTDLDRVSGVWRESHGSEAYSAWWRPTAPEHGWSPDPPAGKLTSTLDRPAGGERGGAGPPNAAVELARRLAALEDDPFEVDANDWVDDEDDGPGGDLIDLLYDAFDGDRTIRLTYAGAGGMRQEWGTIDQMEDARLRLRDHATGKRSWRWLGSIAEVEIVH